MSKHHWYKSIELWNSGNVETDKIGMKLFTASLFTIIPISNSVPETNIPFISVHRTYPNTCTSSCSHVHCFHVRASAHAQWPLSLVNPHLGHGNGDRICTIMSEPPPLSRRNAARLIRIVPRRNHPTTMGNVACLRVHQLAYGGVSNEASLWMHVQYST